MDLSIMKWFQEINNRNELRGQYKKLLLNHYINNEGKIYNRQTILLARISIFNKGMNQKYPFASKNPLGSNSMRYLMEKLFNSESC